MKILLLIGSFLMGAFTSVLYHLLMPVWYKYKDRRASLSAARNIVRLLDEAAKK